MKADPKFLIALCTIIVLLCLSFLVIDAYHWKSISDREMRWFQKLTGGLGMGAVATPSWNIIDFDPRLQPVDESKIWPLPGGYNYSPLGANSVTHFEELLEENGVISERVVPVETSDK